VVHALWANYQVRAFCQDGEAAVLIRRTAISFGNNGAGPQGAPVFGNQGPAAAPVAGGAVPGQAGAPANGATPFYNASFESVLAAVSRGEIPLNIQVPSGTQFSGNSAAVAGLSNAPVVPRIAVAMKICATVSQPA